MPNPIVAQFRCGCRAMVPARGGVLPTPGDPAYLMSDACMQCRSAEFCAAVRAWPARSLGVSNALVAGEIDGALALLRTWVSQRVDHLEALGPSVTTGLSYALTLLETAAIEFDRAIRKMDKIEADATKAEAPPEIPVQP